MGKHLSPKFLLICALLLLSNSLLRAQVTTNGGSGLAATYPSLDAAVTALNAATITSPVVITVTASNPQTAPSGGYVITKEGTASNTITLVGNNNTITASNAQAAGSITDAVFKLVGADYVTLNGFNITENSANTITDAATNNMTEFGIGIFHATTSNGAQFNTITNCTIKLVRTYQNTFGIFSHSNVSSTDVGATTNVAIAGGNNSGLTITSNTINDVNTGIVCFGGSGSGLENDGLVIGGSTPALGNTITNFGGTVASSTFLNLTSTSINGIYVRFTKNYTISNNTITSFAGAGVAAGSLNGIYLPTPTNVPIEGAGVLNMINSNTVSLQSGANDGTIQGIRLETTAGHLYGNTELQINNNNITALTHVSSTPTGSTTAITNAIPAFLQSIDNNKFTNLSASTTGSFTFISSSITLPVGGVQSTSGNSIVTAFNKTGAGGTVTLFTTTSNTPTSCTSTASNNNFSNITVTGTTIIAGWINRDGASTASGPIKTVSNNTFSNWNAGTGSITVLTINASAATSTHTGNVISNINGGGAIVGLSLLGSENGSFSGNNINTLNGTGAAAVSAITLSGTASTNTPSVVRNKIYNIQANNAGGSVNGILISHAGTGITATIANNLIGDLKAPIAFNDVSDAVRGINITATSTTAKFNIYFNTIYINASSSSTGFSTAGIFHTQSATATTATLDLRNNIIINTSTAAGAGATTAAFRRSATGLDNYALTSNNNMFYAGVPSATNLIYSNGTAANQTLADFQTLVASRETASKTENTVTGFISVSGANAGFLHIAPGTMTVCESKAGIGSGITVDYDGDPRSGTLPDIGADEFAGIVPITLSSFSGTKQASGNLLSWTTATEINNTGFELQRSADGVNFSTLTFVASKANNGNSNAVLNYSFVDSKSLFTTGYYRLKQIDKDGKYSISSIVMIKSGKVAGIELTGVYPNPAISNLNVMVSSAKADNISFVVSDLSGRIVLRQQASVVDGENTIKLNVSALAKGTYSIQAVCANGCETAVSKFIKQ